MNIIEDEEEILNQDTENFEMIEDNIKFIRDQIPENIDFENEENIDVVI